MIEYKLFPTKFIRQCIKTYIKEHGKPPKILGINHQDKDDYLMTLSLGWVKSLSDIAPELEIVTIKDLPRGAVDLAIGIKESI